MEKTERTKEGQIVSRMIVAFVKKIQRKGLFFHGEYCDMLIALAFVIHKEGDNHCYELDDLIRKYIEKKYGLQAGSRSDEVTEVFGVY